MSCYLCRAPSAASIAESRTCALHREWLESSRAQVLAFLWLGPLQHCESGPDPWHQLQCDTSQKRGSMLKYSATATTHRSPADQVAHADFVRRRPRRGYQCLRIPAPSTNARPSYQKIGRWADRSISWDGSALEGWSSHPDK